MRRLWRANPGAFPAERFQAGLLPRLLPGKPRILLKRIFSIPKGESFGSRLFGFHAATKPLSGYPHKLKPAAE
jgi:hypothetical protein